MIIWVNGTFGVGKSSACRELVELLPGSTLFDPEGIGDYLRRALPRRRLAEVGDYQDLPAWRRLVPEAAATVLAEVPGALVVPMTLLREAYRDEIFGALAARGLTVHHFVLHAEETILRERIGRDTRFADDPAAAADCRDWRLAHLPAYQQAQPWLRRDARVLDTAELTPVRSRREWPPWSRRAPRAARSCAPPTRRTTRWRRRCCSSTRRTGCCWSTRSTSPTGSSPVAWSSAARRPRWPPSARPRRNWACGWTRRRCGCWPSTGSRAPAGAGVACGWSTTADA